MSASASGADPNGTAKLRHRWTAEEDAILLEFIEEHGDGAGKLLRNGCRAETSTMPGCGTSIISSLPTPGLDRLLQTRTLRFCVVEIAETRDGTRSQSVCAAVTPP
eukprot:CAMPEP_0185831396 /NCGR_PEP_ID=MMETSP1353-20130828/1464_1 /TAXON_ID=1077150 /ORGANISM="Erythrolobus australicus, Strain CCMP3124" /LENGTH=105 /DNA_ID=CAMNT_0028529449 /DNA_START=307 /DNA_END=625 /DNA_ORIENTATION=+